MYWFIECVSNIITVLKTAVETNVKNGILQGKLCGGTGPVLLYRKKRIKEWR